MKADFEPWWKFDGWESNIVTTHVYNTEEQFNIALNNMLDDFRNKYDHEESREGKYYAFWSKDECEYCEACEDDAQIFHGIIIEK